MAGKEHLRLRRVKTGSLRLDRRSGTGRSGTPKKGGAGGKHTWGAAVKEFDDFGGVTVDEFDPNYSDTEVEVVDTRNTAKGIMKEEK